MALPLPDRGSSSGPSATATAPPSSSTPRPSSRSTSTTSRTPRTTTTRACRSSTSSSSYCPSATASPTWPPSAPPTSTRTTSGFERACSTRSRSATCGSRRGSSGIRTRTALARRAGFRDEAERRIKKLKAEGEVGSGDRIRIIGYPDSSRSTARSTRTSRRTPSPSPGSAFTALDGVDIRRQVPCLRARAVQGGREASATTPLRTAGHARRRRRTAKAILLGDLAYPTRQAHLRRARARIWNGTSCSTPHHCSKSVLYGSARARRADAEARLLDEIEAAPARRGEHRRQLPPIPATNEPGDDPPHASRGALREIVATGLPLYRRAPHRGRAGADRVRVRRPRVRASRARRAKAATRAAQVGSAAITAGRGGDDPPRQPVGFGRWR